MAFKLWENQHRRWCSSMVSICPTCRRSWLRSLAPQNQNAYKKIKNIYFQRLCNTHFPVLLVIPKAHGKKPSSCRIKSSTSKKLLWFSLKYSHVLEITSLGLFIKLLPVFMCCTMCAWCSWLGKRGTWSSRWLWTWVLITKPRTSAIATSGLNQWALLQPRNLFNYTHSTLKTPLCRHDNAH